MALRPSVVLKVNGIKPMQRRLDEVGVTLAYYAGRALHAEGTEILAKARSLAPRGPSGVSGSGDLRDSAEIDKPRRDLTGISVTLAFGRSGPSAAYALAHHEHPSPHSPPSWRSHPSLDYTYANTGVKYLERPLRDAAASFQASMARRIKL